MQTKIIEASQGKGSGNWGKFLLARFDNEWQRKVMLPEVADKEISLLSGIGWTKNHFLILDLQTGEGAVFSPGGSPAADLKKHAVWVCPLFEPFLGWVYKQDLSDLNALPDFIALPEAEFMMYGHRRPGRVKVIGEPLKVEFD